MNNYMKIANELAKENLTNNHGGPFGAVIVKNNKIIGQSNNQVLATNDPTAHAEIMAIRNACQNIKSYDLSGCEIYTNCYPCPMCLSAIIWANIKTVYYANTKKDAANIGFRDDLIYQQLKNKLEIIETIKIDDDETIKTFKEFKEKIRLYINNNKNKRKTPFIFNNLQKN